MTGVVVPHSHMLAARRLRQYAKATNVPEPLFRAAFRAWTQLQRELNASQAA